MKRIENREILQQARKETSEKIEKSRCRILICAGTGCLAGGSGEIYEKMCELTAENPDVDVFFGTGDRSHRGRTKDGTCGSEKERMSWVL